MKKKKTNVHRRLDRAGIHYMTHEYAWNETQLDAETAAENLEMDLNTVYKTLITVGDKTGPIVSCIPAMAILDLKVLAKVSGNKKVDMLPMKDLEKVTGYIRGGCSPIGMKKNYPTYIDTSAENMKTIVISAGKRGFQVEIAPQDLLQATNGVYERITQEQRRKRPFSDVQTGALRNEIKETR
jgi:Cys-tRNA(Pro)/Cys-tRNA(Cys) deacylase